MSAGISFADSPGCAVDRCDLVLRSGTMRPSPVERSVHLGAFMDSLVWMAFDAEGQNRVHRDERLQSLGTGSRLDSASVPCG